MGQSPPVNMFLLFLLQPEPNFNIPFKNTNVPSDSVLSPLNKLTSTFLFLSPSLN